MTGGLSGTLRRKVDKDILDLSKESKSFVVAEECSIAVQL